MILNTPPHSWALTPLQAIALQKQLRDKVLRKDSLGAVRHVAGTDVGFEQSGAVSRAAAVVLTYPGLELADYSVARLPTCPACCPSAKRPWCSPPSTRCA
jgi:deoxyribonuclease V